MALLPFLKKKEEPQDIELLPEEAVESVKIKRDVLVAVTIFAGTLILIATFFLAGFLLGQKERSTLARTKGQIVAREADWKKFADTAQVLATIQTDLKTYREASAKNQDFHGNLIAIRDNLPVSLIITDLILDKDNKAALEGKAAAPSDIYQLVETLKSQGRFSLVSLQSISYSAAEGRYIFGISFMVKKNEKDNT